MSSIFRSWIQLKIWHHHHLVVVSLLIVFCSPLQGNLCTSRLVHRGLLCTHLWKERSESEYSVHRLGNCVEDLETGSSSDSAGTCLLKYLFASRLMEDIWRLDIFRFTPLLHLFRVWLALAMNLFTVPWSRHNSFAISVDFLPSARQRTIVYSFPLQWDLSACPSLAL